MKEGERGSVPRAPQLEQAIQGFKGSLEWGVGVGAQQTQKLLI